MDLPAVTTDDRNTNGQFLPGHKGLGGRPPSAASVIKDAKETLEGYLRSRVPKEKAAKALENLVDRACSKNAVIANAAAKILMPYILSKPGEGGDAPPAEAPTYIFRIERAEITTVEPKALATSPALEGEFTEVNTNERGNAEGQKSD